MKSNMKWTALAAAAAIQSCVAQTYSDCNPTEETCSANTGLDSWSFTTDFTTGDDAFDGWNVTSGSITSTDLGAEFVINEQGDAPTIETDFYIFFGYFEVKFRASNGTGIVSTAILESDDLDELDWEQVSTFNSEIETNYFGKGNTSSYDRATTVSVETPTETFHTYGISWTEEKTEWFIDGTSVRTLNYADAVDGTNYPQTPSRIRIGIWAGGDPDNSEGTIEWAGGETDYTQAPFKMYVESVSITNYNPAKSYTYTDKTGSFDSIEASNSTSGTTTSSSSTSLISSSTTSSSSTASSGAADSDSSSSDSSSTGSASSTPSASGSATPFTGGTDNILPSSTGALWVLLAAFGVGML
ncbi:concanavalin A-like lectin/glucanase domain-containing protein [Aspergillus californicus]